MRNLVWKFILVAAAIPLVGSPCLAGTGGIFPANNPRRKIQTITPIESPTSLQQSGPFRTRTALPSLPSTAGAVPDDSDKSSGSSSTLPLHGVNDPSTGSGVGESGGSRGDVASFFQLNPASTARSIDLTVPKSEAKLDAELDQTSPPSSKSVVTAPFRFVWHAMDNAGVPMFFGKHDADLDPSLRKGYEGMNSIQPNIPTAKAVAAPSMKTGSANDSAASLRTGSAKDSMSSPRPDTVPSNRVPNKIPASELEGTQKNPVDNNDEMP